MPRFVVEFERHPISEKGKMVIFADNEYDAGEKVCSLNLDTGKYRYTDILNVELHIDDKAR